MIKNSKLQNMIELSSRLTIYIPSTVNVDEPIDNKKHVDEAAALLSGFFGGATSTEASGYWLSPSAGLVRERSTMVFTYCHEADLEAHIDEVIDYCEALKQTLTQDAIALEINGKMYFI